MWGELWEYILQTPTWFKKFGFPGRWTFKLIPRELEVVKMKRTGNHISDGPMTRGIMINWRNGKQINMAGAWLKRGVKWDCRGGREADSGGPCKSNEGLSIYPSGKWEPLKICKQGDYRWLAAWDNAWICGGLEPALALAQGSQLLNIQEFCQLVVKLSGVWNRSWWEWTNTTK